MTTFVDLNLDIPKISEIDDRSQTGIPSGHPEKCVPGRGSSKAASLTNAPLNALTRVCQLIKRLIFAHPSLKHIRGVRVVEERGRAGEASG